MQELDLFDIFFHLHRVSKDRETRLMALLSGVAVFKDLVPGYRIREPTEQERAQIRSKPVLALERYELKLLQTYRRLLPDLEAMSWQLALEGPRHCDPAGEPPLLLLPGSAQVGRGQTAHIRSTHQSVSRVHAELVVVATQGSLDHACPLEISLIDRSSTGHTFVNELKTPGKGVAVKLKDGDFFTCGIDPLRYTLKWKPIVLSISSRLSSPELQNLKDLARACGVFLTSEWTLQCTHLLIEQWAITPKLLCCVADGALPVASSFLDELVSRRDAELRPPPTAASCSPSPPAGADAAYTAELTAYAGNPSPRRELLKGNWVIFSAKQAYDTLHLPLEHAGASLLVLTQDVPASSVVQDLKRGVASHGAPEEVWIIPALPPGLPALLSELGELRCPCLVVGQQAVVAALLSGQKTRATHAATLIPKTELPDSFPETHQQHDSTQQQAPLQQRKSRISRKRPLPWEAAPAEEPASSLRSHGAPPGPPPQPSPGPPHASPTGTGAGGSVEHAPGPGHAPLLRPKPEPEPAEEAQSQRATLSLRATVPPVPTKPELDQKQEEKINAGTLQSVHSTYPPPPPEVKAEQEEFIIDGAEPVVHPTGTWLNPLKARVSNRLVLEGVELPRASWTTADKRAPEVRPPEGKPNYKRFRKGQCAAVTTFVHVVPWAPPARRVDFETQPSIEMRESEIPNLGM
ncbi:NBN [Symbiodinium natans]|uniref:NBN protein n=1 Tax=Symbiodinium natans TaxID=878477 RepID=A0A812MXJ9_9DINO|nr:NBN [Symbiodinium natans]